MGWWTLAHTQTHMRIEKMSHQKQSVAMGQDVTEWGNSNMKNRREKCHRMGKMQQETDWKYVTDGQNVTIQVKEGGHDVTSDMMSTL